MLDAIPFKFDHEQKANLWMLIEQTYRQMVTRETSKIEKEDKR